MSILQTLPREGSYAAFQRKLIPNVPPETILGIRTPDLRRRAKEIRGTPEAERFLQTLPHRFFEENQLHGFLLSLEADFPACLTGIEAFLPHMDNWATCDQTSPAVFGKHKAELLPRIRVWIRSEHVYTFRFAVGMLMRHYLDESFDPALLELAADPERKEYYERMMIAWYFATALAKQYEQTLPYLTERRLDPWTHNKAVQKAMESFRIPPERKAYLRTLKIRV